MKTFRNFVLAIASTGLILLFLTKWNFENTVAFDTIASFLSITMGFTIAALSIIATSPFSLLLYKQESEIDNSKTLLHELVDKFRNSTYLFITTIGSILLFKFFQLPKNELFCIATYSISLFDVFKTAVWYLTICSFVGFTSLFNIFSKFVIKSASKTKSS